MSHCWGPIVWKTGEPAQLRPAHLANPHSALTRTTNGPRIPIRSKEDSFAFRGTLLAAFPSAVDSLLSAEILVWPAIVAGVGLISILFWLPFVHGLTRSIDRMMEATSRIAGGDFNVQ